MPSFNGSKRRQSKQAFSSKKSSPPSTLSVTSNGSPASSNASVTTPKNIFHSSLRPSKRLGAKTHQAQEEQPEDRSEGHTRKKSIEAKNSEVDVFAFMDREADDVSDRSSIEDKTSDVDDVDDLEDNVSTVSDPAPIANDGPQRSPRYSDLEVRAIQDGMQRSWGRGSLHSDSGISVHSGSPDQDSPIMQHKLPAVQKIPSIEETGPEQDQRNSYNAQLSPTRYSDRGSPFPTRYWSGNDHNEPETYRVSPPRMLMQEPYNHAPPMPEIYSRPVNDMIPSRPRYEKSRPSIAKTGYEYLASNIGSRDDAVLKPIYRKFEMLNNRMLLYLQDEISEMEDDLRDLDSAIAQEDVDLGKRSASRRSEAKLPSQLQWHRIDLLNRTFAKVEQYNRALTSYSNLTKSLDPASQTDIVAYSAWIAEHTPIAEAEAGFLTKDKDLLIVKPTKASSTADSQQAHLYETPIMVVAFSLVSTIIVFKVVPKIFARLVISAMVGIASACTLSPEVPKNWRQLRDWRRGIAMYAAVMLVLAIVVS